MVSKEVELLEEFLKENASEELKEVIDETVNEVTNQPTSYEDIAELIISYFKDDENYNRTTVRDAIYFGLTDDLENPYYDELWNNIDNIMVLSNE